MEPTERTCIFAGLVILLSILITECNTSPNSVNCIEINEKSSIYYSQFFIDGEIAMLDSALLYIEQGLENCEMYNNILTMRKIGILSEKQEYMQAIKFINKIEDEMFSELPYYKELLKSRLKVMKAIKEGDVETKNIQLSECVSLVENYLDNKKMEIDSLQSLSNIENILADPLSTAFTQYYYYKSRMSSLEAVKTELRNKVADERANSDFIEYLIDYLSTDIMDFQGI